MEKATLRRKAILAAFTAAFAAALLVLAGCSCSASSSASSASGSSASSDAMFTVPNVVSLTQSDAEKSILSSGFMVGTITREASDTIPSGSVISQDPKELTSAKANSKINLVISTGKAAPKDVTTPDLKGKTQADAEKALSDVGLVGVASNPEETSEVEPGLVFKQSVAAGEVVKEGTRVAFTVALAPSTAAVPDVVGKTGDEAAEIIKKAGFSYDSTATYDDNVAEGKVISQSYAAGTQLQLGSTISVSISLGPKPVENVKVPNVVTYSWADAKAALQSAGLAARYTGDPAGVVVSQDIKAGTEVAPNTLVTVTLASETKMVKVPNLVGMSVTSAEEATDKIGLVLKMDGAGAHGTVVEQWPEAGTKVEVRSTVYVEIDTSEFE